MFYTFVIVNNYMINDNTRTVKRDYKTSGCVEEASLTLIID